MKGYTPRKYVRPPPVPAERRVYELPGELVQRIREYGYQEGCRSEVEAARALLDAALKARGI